MVWKSLRWFILEEDGLEMVEWSIVAALVVSGAAIIIEFIGLKVFARLAMLNIALS